MSDFTKSLPLPFLNRSFCYNVYTPLFEVNQENKAPPKVSDSALSRVEDGVALFPDGVTSRGRRHLEHLRELAGQGHQAWNVFVVQRHDARVLRPAAAVDPAYARELAIAAAHGVNILVLQEKISPPEITLASRLPFDLT